MDEWLSDHEKGGFYASQDADYSMDDDGDYFTWTLDEAKAVLTEEEAQAACLHYDINEIGEMHHNPAKNVLFVRASVEEIGKRMSLPSERGGRVASGRQRENVCGTPPAANAITSTKPCTPAGTRSASRPISKPPGCLDWIQPGMLALRALDRILAEAWHEERGLMHVIAYSDANSERREVPGLLDDYAFATIACLDAYEATSDLAYFNFARRLGDRMIERFFDAQEGGFFDTQDSSKVDGKALGVLGTPRKPFQDSPTPAGNSVAAIALLRLHAYTGEAGYRDRAGQTIEILAGVAGQYGLFAATYGIAAASFAAPHTQVVVSGMTNRQTNFMPQPFVSFVLGKLSSG